MALQQDEIASLLSGLDKQPELSIIKLSEPILTQPGTAAETNARSSDASFATGGDGVSRHPTPASLEADLTHYKELFTKLRFSYVEQVTKEKFLRAIVGDPPLYVSAAENAELEATLATAKASLKAQKEEVAHMLSTLEQQGRELSGKYDGLQEQTEQLRSLPNEIDGLRRTVADLSAAQDFGEEDPVLALPLDGTLEVLEEKEAELAALDHEFAMLESAVDTKTQELERLHLEMKPLQAQKATAVAAAKEARSRKEQGSGGVGDALEEKGRWLRASESTLRKFLEVES